mmetsp:Transcript_30425/g.33992  ORF Transcript_30425/g.33992 Transcript_30425/m.33992 type:complete len:228 (-) Transcript_30425:122-805(-)
MAMLLTRTAIRKYASAGGTGVSWHRTSKSMLSKDTSKHVTNSLLNTGKAIEEKANLTTSQVPKPDYTTKSMLSKRVPLRQGHYSVSRFYGSPKGVGPLHFTGRYSTSTAEKPRFGRERSKEEQDYGKMLSHWGAGLTLGIVMPIGLLFDLGMLNVIPDAAMALVIPYHGYQGIHEIIHDYVPKSIQGGLDYLMLALSIVGALGLLRLTFGDGIGNSLRLLWSKNQPE